MTRTRPLGRSGIEVSAQTGTVAQVAENAGATAHGPLAAEQVDEIAGLLGH